MYGSAGAFYGRGWYGWIVTTAEGVTWWVRVENPRLPAFSIRSYSWDGVKVAQIDSYTRHNVLSLEFAFGDRGCDEFVITFASEPPTGFEYGTLVTIHLFNDSFPWYSGVVLEKTRLSPWEYQVRGYGLAWYFSTIINKTFTSTTIANIVNFLASLLESKTLAKILYRSDYINAPATAVAKLKAEYVRIDDVLQALAQMAGGYVYGVNERRYFYFKPRPFEVTLKLWAGLHLSEFTVEEDFSELANRLYVLSTQKNADGSYYLFTVEDSASQSSYGLREDVLQIPHDMDATTAQSYADAILQQRANPKLIASVSTTHIPRYEPVRAEGQARIYDNSTGAYWDFPLVESRYIIAPERGISLELTLGEKTELSEEMRRFLAKLRGEELARRFADENL